ncbi:alpha/beta fold hydrolase [Hoeflea sp. TYP-13]|uniref:alpha/beta fold hydrolase n=1 Tax=Hoeflea sp. TYP-13 TaxID=3230023 RepID=UPI0034C6A6BA
MNDLQADADDQPRLGEADVGDVTLGYTEWHRELRGTGPTLLFIHATGFHARIWDEIVKRLPAHHIICLDQRGHGRSTGTGVKHWQVFCDDLIGFVEALDLSDIVAIGHSMGGHAAIAAAAKLQTRFRKIILIDPVVMPPAYYDRAAAIFPEGTLHPSAKRRRNFQTAEEMIERFEDRSPYSLFTRQTLENYCRHGLVPNEDGEGLTLACAPDMEASVYTASLSNKAIFDHARAVEIPVLILRANAPDDPANLSFTSSPTWEGLVDVFPNAREIYRPDLTHFMPMQVPGEMADLIVSELEGA